MESHYCFSYLILFYVLDFIFCFTIALVAFFPTQWENMNAILVMKPIENLDSSTDVLIFSILLNIVWHYE